MAAISFLPSAITSVFNGSNEPAAPGPLNSFVSHDPISSESSNIRWKWLWRSAATITAVSFIAAATFAIVYVTAFFESQLLLVSIIVFGAGLPLSARVIQYLWDKSTAAAREASVDGEFIRHMNAIQDIELPVRLNGLGVAPGLPPEKLKGLFARYCYFKEKQHKAKEAANKIFDPEIEINLGKSNVVRINPEDYTVEKIDFADKQKTVIFHKLQELRNESNDLLRLAAECNLKAAYVLKLMQSPYEKREFEEFVQFNPFGVGELLLAKNYGDKGTAILAKAKGRSYTIGQLCKQDTTSLSREVFELPKKWFGLI